MVQGSYQNAWSIQSITDVKTRQSHVPISSVLSPLLSIYFPHSSSNSAIFQAADQRGRGTGDGWTEGRKSEWSAWQCCHHHHRRRRHAAGRRLSSSVGRRLNDERTATIISARRCVGPPVRPCRSPADAPSLPHPFLHVRHHAGSGSGGTFEINRRETGIWCQKND